MNNQPKEVCWDKSHHSIFEDFALDFKDFPQTKKLPAYGDEDLNYCLGLQKKRLKDKKLLMKYDLVPRGLFAEGGGGKSWSDDHYISRMEYRSCRLVRSFYRNQKKIYEKKKNYLFYQIITNVFHSDVAAGDLYTCPSCGAISQIAALQKGCPYCDTFFEMKDLFPKVTNFYFIEDSGGTKKELKHSMRKVMLPCGVLGMIGYTVYFLTIGAEGGIAHALLSGIFSGVLFGILIGYFLWAMIQLFTLFKNAGKAMPMVWNVAGSEKRFVSQMKKYSPEFSYEYFSDKVVSILKMIIYAEDAKEIPNYTGEPLGNLFSDIVDASYTGAVALKQFQVRNDYCYVTADVYMENIYDNGSRIYDKNDTVRICLCKNIRKPINLHFSIQRIQCKGCGSSFDAARQRNCPSCGKKYEMEDDDWIVTKIQKR